MIHVIALKTAASLCGFLWAVVSVENRWGWPTTLTLCIAALTFGVSAALDLGRLGSREWHDDE